MIEIRSFDTTVRALNERFPGKELQARADGSGTRIHLYHAPNSICSQKVRAVLFHTGRPFVSHLLDIFKGETYDADYVWIRIKGCNALGLPFAIDHPGTTSATTIGCDACVVPTIVMETSGEVVVDSKNICLELDRQNPAAPGALVPEALRDVITSELSIVDNLPNYQLLAVSVGKQDETAADNSFAVSKVRRCDALIAAHANDAALCAAYAAKRAKEQAAADRLFNAAAMDRARLLIEDALAGLDTRLQHRDGRYLFGDFVTMADLFWAVELIRLHDLGLSSCWSDGRLPSLATYYQAILELPSISAAVTEWPGARLKPRSTIAT